MLMLMLTACHVNLVAPYSDQVVRDAVAVQTDFDTLAQTLRDPPTGTNVGYDANKAAYNKINVDLTGLLTRAQANPNNQAMIDSINKLIAEVQKMEAEHKTNGHLSAAYLETKQATIDQQIAILIRTETDKKALN
jgi:hypothetical protein